MGTPIVELKIHVDVDVERFHIQSHTFLQIFLGQRFSSKDLVVNYLLSPE